MKKTTHSIEFYLPVVPGVSVWASFNPGGAKLYASSDESETEVRRAVIHWLAAVNATVKKELEA